MKLLGCDVDPKLPLVTRLVSTSIMLYVIAAAVALLIFALAAYYSRRKWQDDRDLNKNLMEKQKQGKVDVENGPSFMYINGDLTWKPLPSDQQYAAHQIQPVCTMSTVSTGKYLEEKVQPSNGEDANRIMDQEKESVSSHERSLIGFDVRTLEDATVPTMIGTLDDSENRIISPIQTSESSDEGYVFEDNIPSPISSDDGEQKVEDE